MSSSSDCFVVVPPYCEEGTTVLGRNFENALSSGDAASCEVQYYEASTAVEGSSDGGATPEVSSETLRLILQRPSTNIWGGDIGANERSVCVAVTWTTNEPEKNSGNLLSTDVVRYALATSKDAGEAVERIGSLVENHASNDAKMNFVICDPVNVWVVSCAVKLWAAQHITTFYRISSKSLAVTTTINKSSAELNDALKTLGVWNGEGELNFAAVFDASSEVTWDENEPSSDGSFELLNMFETLRAAKSADTSLASNVSLLTSKGISTHWFTCTPNVNQSVFKPFVFAPNPKISPLTKVSADRDVTLLHYLHAQRKPTAVDDLRNLETSCISEVTKYLVDHDTSNDLDELDELMKDCVEAEVKFYR
ncbi:secernin-1 [Teleopsis dalmanni]|uniref:secernin-1 n=1 Tax=Teleopsis dalmanni TaxID=139649 RepID=UPI0018CF1AA9|nr:secernin-1 [Teleopsis dalmanni]